jgi:MerR family transcriptional regulator, thiopeptide resistance regulator
MLVRTGIYGTERWTLRTTPETNRQEASLKVGELARRSGVSVRTLHFYGEIGLLVPSEHTLTGHRLYSVHDVARLQQIVSLRQLGLSLKEIGETMVSGSVSPAEVVNRHLTRIRDQIELQRQLCDRLERVAGALRSAVSPSIDDLLQAIEVTKMLEKYTPEQRALFEERARIVGQERIKEVEAEWPVLIAEVRAEMAAGTDPSSEKVQALMRRWTALGREFHGDNQELIGVLRESVTGLPARDPSGGLDQEVIAYIARAQKR